MLRKRIFVILKDDFLNVPFNIRHANMISNDIADKSNIILNYCVTNNRRNFGAVRLKSPFERRYEIGRGNISKGGRRLTLTIFIRL